MTMTGESPSPVETCYHWEPEGDCVAARQGGGQPKGSSQAQNGLPRLLNPIRRIGAGRVCVGMTKPGTKVSRKAATNHVRELTLRNPNVCGVSMRAKRRQNLEV